MKPVTNKKGDHQKQNKLSKEILDDLSWFVFLTVCHLLFNTVIIFVLFNFLVDLLLMFLKKNDKI